MSTASSATQAKPKLEPWRVERVNPNGPPSPTSWGPTPSTPFQNHGLNTWTKTRQIWNIRTIPSSSYIPPPPVDYDVLVRGLTANGGNFRAWELPGRMRLQDLVEVYIDCWECEDED